MSRGKRMNAEKIEKLLEWKRKGLNVKDCAEVCGVSEQTAQKYLSIVNNISLGKDYCINQKSVNEDAILAYCLKNGFKKTINTYQTNTDVIVDENGYEDATTKVEEVRAKMYAGVDALLNWLMGVWK